MDGATNAETNAAVDISVATSNKRVHLIMACVFEDYDVIKGITNALEILLILLRIDGESAKDPNTRAE